MSHGQTPKQIKAGWIAEEQGIFVRAEAKRGDGRLEGQGKRQVRSSTKRSR
jgi:hypothetical protein